MAQKRAAALRGQVQQEGRYSLDDPTSSAFNIRDKLKAEVKVIPLDEEIAEADADALLRYKGRTLTIVCPGNDSLVKIVDATMEEAMDKGDLNFDPYPYWTSVWASSVALSRLIRRNDEFLLQKRHKKGAGCVEGLNVLEIGSGLGIGGLAAALCGARKVTLSDYEDKSFPWVYRSAAESGVSEKISCECLNWRFRETWPDNCDLVLAADILYYSEEDFSDVAAATRHALLKRKGMAVFVDPERLPQAVDKFCAVLQNDFKFIVRRKRISRF